MNDNISFELMDHEEYLLLMFNVQVSFYIIMYTYVY